MPSNLLGLLCSALLLCGCDSHVTSSKQPQTFFITTRQPISLETPGLSLEEITKIFEQAGLSIAPHQSLHVKIESSLESNNVSCPLKATTVQETFLRLTLYTDREEVYRLQYNGLYTIKHADIKRLILQMKKEMVKEGSFGRLEPSEKRY